MARFDEAVNKAKETIDIVTKKTNAVVNVQKQKFSISSLESKREKDYATLGRLYYDSVVEDREMPGSSEDIIDAIMEKNRQISDLKAEIARSKNDRICPGCGAVVDQEAVFCSTCGIKLILD